MNLDDFSAFKKLDPQDMLGHIDTLPQQLGKAWEMGKNMQLPAWSGIRQVLVTGMGGSAIGADLLAAYASNICPIPFLVHRDYGLPAWASGPEVLVIASSHSGNTEETLSAFEAAQIKGCLSMAICTGGKLAKLATEARKPVWTFEHHGQPRAAVGYSFGLLLAALVRMQIIPDPSEELGSAIEAIQTQQARINSQIQASQNPAKRLAGQLVGRAVTVFGSGVLTPVARRWKCQVNEIAKAWAQFEFLPEADHNTLAGTLNPEDLFSRTMILFLQSASDHPRNRLRSELTHKSFMIEGLNTDVVEAQGNTPMAQMWSSLHFGDYVAYYLAMAYGVDPTPVSALVNFKQEMQAVE